MKTQPSVKISQDIDGIGELVESKIVNILKQYPLIMQTMKKIQVQNYWKWQKQHWLRKHEKRNQKKEKSRFKWKETKENKILRMTGKSYVVGFTIDKGQLFQHNAERKMGSTRVSELCEKSL